MKTVKLLFLTITAILGIIAGGMSVIGQATSDYPIEPVPFTSVRVTDTFWLPRIETNRTVTIPYIM